MEILRNNAHNADAFLQLVGLMYIIKHNLLFCVKKDLATELNKKCMALC